MTYPTDFERLNVGSPKGNYKHIPTGFYVHEINNVGDAIKANGVLACDLTNNRWCWVAGEDLYLEVYRRTKMSLRALATALLNSDYQLVSEGITITSHWTNVGTMNVGYTVEPVLKRNALSLGADIRIFGILTNVQAGRGCSPNMLNTRIAGAGQVVTAYCNATIPGYIPATGATAGGGTGRNDGTFNPSNGCIGRAIIAIPLGGWEKFLSKWKESVPNIDQAEIASKADAALAMIKSEHLSRVFVNPHVRIPVTLYADGSIAHDGNPTMSIACYGVGSKPLIHSWNSLLLPTIKHPDGWYSTNPFVAGNATHQLPKVEFAGIGYGFDSATAGLEAPMSAAAFAHGTAVKIKSIGGVPLFHIFGGLSPSAVHDGAALTENALLSLLMNNCNSESSVSAQGGSETGEQYSARLTTEYANSPSGTHLLAYGHWVKAGQVPLLVTEMLHSAMLGKKFDVLALMYMGGGTVCSPFRVADGAANLNYVEVDVLADTARWLRHQYA